MKYDLKKSSVLLNVHELCSLALISGDLDNRGGVHAPWMEEAKIGTELHKELQQNRGEGYQAEVFLSNFSILDGMMFEVSGRADGVMMLPNQVKVEEIKVHIGKFASMEPTLFQKAQALVYAHFLCTFHQISEICVCLTVVNADTKEVNTIEEIYSENFLSEYYRKLLSSILPLAKLLVDRETNRLPSAAGAKFPFPSVREGQEIMMKAGYSAIKRGKRLFLQAPTGTGKTISSLYPAVKALGNRYCEKVFYLTAKASTRKEAYKAASDLYSSGAHLRTITLYAKDQMCVNQQAKEDPSGVSSYCNPINCPRAAGFYDRLPLALEKLLFSKSGYPRQTIDDIANEFSLCPYEFSLEVALFCDIIICDYNCAFDPMNHLRRFFGEEAEDKGKYVLLVDEAHNLSDRAGDMYSAELKLSEMQNLYDSCAVSYRKILEEPMKEAEALRTLTADSSEQDSEGKSHGYYLTKKPMEKWNQIVAKTKHVIEKKLIFANLEELDPKWKIFYRNLSKYQKISEFYDERFLTFVETDGEELTVRQICLDPSGVLDFVLSKLKASIFFSATLTPTEYFSDILGGGKHPIRVSLPSPFDSNRQQIVIMKGVSTRFEDRNQSVKAIVSAIAGTVSAKSGNYIVYFPSYDYMEKVAQAFSKKYPNVPLILQEKGMNSAKKEVFLESFSDDSKLRIGFCVLGGSFSEGVDLPGKRLIGTIIVGVGLPGLSSEKNILKEYYDQTREQGYEYAYTYPGMNRVLQAAGRVIRTEDDCGIVVLIDDRYATPNYQVLFPEHWKKISYASNSIEIAEIAKEFWKNIKKS